MMIVYKSKASNLIKLLFAIAVVVLLIFTLVERSWALLGVTLGFIVLTIYLFLETNYTVYENALTVKSGFLYKEIIDIENIRKIKISKRNLFSGPGFSKNRLMIFYNENDCSIISPDQQSIFLKHLKRINPDIEIVGKG